MARFDKIFLSLILYPVFPVLFFLLGWWVSLLIIKDNSVFIYASIGLVLGILINILLVRKKIPTAYELTDWYWQVVYIFYSLCFLGFFMGVPVFNLLLGIPAGILVVRIARIKGLSLSEESRLIENTSRATALFLIFICIISAHIALDDPYTGENLKGMLNLPFGVTRPMVVGLILIGGAILIPGQYLITKVTALIAVRRTRLN